MKEQDIIQFVKKVTDTGASAASAVGEIVTNAAEKAQNVITSTTKKISVKIEEQKAVEAKERKEKYNAAIEPLLGTAAETLITSLGNSPIDLTDIKVSQLHNHFPIPREQYVFWADAEFDLRPSGIAVTTSGLYIRTNVGAFEGKIKFSANKKGHGENQSEETDEISQHHNKFDNGKSVLLFYSWADFNPAWFTDESELENTALLVEPQCSKRFIDVCRVLVQKEDASRVTTIDNIDTDATDFTRNIQAGIVTAAAVESAQTAVFVEHKAAINTPAGHGEMAEEAITMLDNLHGLHATVVGRDNVKDGADRLIDTRIFIQTKYYNSARGSLEACFNPETKNYRYMHDGQPMQLEVPKDQYQKVLEGFKLKIKYGKVPGVTDPAKATDIVRQGRLTYTQAVNLTKPGTIESLTYDALTGTVMCSCAFGLTFVTTLFLTYRKTGDIKEAIQAGMTSGLQVFGLSFIQHMIVSQVARTSLANSLMAPSQYVTAKLGSQASATIVNGIRSLSGKGAIYGAAASKHLAKILRSNVLTSALTFVAFSVPETYNVSSRKISGAQYAKNMSSLAGSIIGSAGGAVCSGVVAAKIAVAVGTAVAPGVGTVVGMAGGFIGGAAGAATVKTFGDILHENDIEIYGRLFNAYVSVLISEYLLDEDEIDKLVKRLDLLKPKVFKTLFENIAKAKEQEAVVRAFLEPHYEEIIKERPAFELPNADSIAEVMDGLIG